MTGTLSTRNMEAVQKGWSVKKVRNTVIIIFLLVAAIFAYLFYANKDFSGLLFNNLPVPAGKPTFLFAIYGSGQNGGFKKPMGVTTYNNRIYVTDTDHQRVQVFDYSGNFISLFGIQGKGNGQFKFPYGIAADGKGQIYISDMYNGNISIFDANGKFLKNFAGNKDISKPAGIAISGNRLYATDLVSSNVKVFDLTSGKKVLDIGQAGNKNGQLTSPNYVAVNGGRVYVADSGNDRVQIFDAQTGKYIDTFKSFDNSGQSRFTNPRGISVDGRGTVFVVSMITNRVYGYNTSGKELFAFGSMGQNDENFALPNGLTIDNNGRIYITDTVNQRVDVYQN